MTTWQEQFSDDFITKTFYGMNRQEIQRDAIDYFTDFFEKEMLKARKEVEGDLGQGGGGTRKMYQNK